MADKGLFNGLALVPSWLIPREQIVLFEDHSLVVHPFMVAQMESTDVFDRLKRGEAIVIAEANRKLDAVLARLDRWAAHEPTGATDG